VIFFQEESLISRD